MQKKFATFAIAVLAILLILFAHIGARLTATVPAFTFAEEARELYLTFDDGPSTVVTNRILDTLREEAVKATFFIVGERVHGREETLQRIAQEGLTIGVHSNTHRYDTIYASEQAFLEDVSACAKIIEETAKIKPHVYRFPGGGTHKRKAKLLEDLGYEIVPWNAVCGDEEIPNAAKETLVNTALKTAAGKRKVVLLCHDSATHAPTAAALPEIIRRFRAEGYAFKAF